MVTFRRYIFATWWVSHSIPLLQRILLGPTVMHPPAPVLSKVSHLSTLSKPGSGPELRSKSPQAPVLATLLEPLTLPVFASLRNKPLQAPCMVKLSTVKTILYLKHTDSVELSLTAPDIGVGHCVATWSKDASSSPRQLLSNIPGRRVTPRFTAEMRKPSHSDLVK